VWSGAGIGGERPFRWTMATSDRVVVPNLMPYPQHFVLMVAPAGAHFVIVRWDGEVVAMAPLYDGWQAVEWDVHDMTVGDHELTIESALGPFEGDDAWPRAQRPVGVAVNLLELTFLRP
jgi:hypothetical protein